MLSLADTDAVQHLDAALPGKTYIYQTSVDINTLELKALFRHHYLDVSGHVITIGL